MNDEVKKPNRAGRWVGGVIFALGMGMLGTVFVLAVSAFLELPQILDAARRVFAASELQYPEAPSLLSILRKCCSLP